MPGQARILTSKEISRIQKFLPAITDQVLFALGIYAGLRVGEIVQIRYDQLYTESGGKKRPESQALEELQGYWR